MECVVLAGRCGMAKDKCKWCEKVIEKAKGQLVRVHRFNSHGEKFFLQFVLCDECASKALTYWGMARTEALFNRRFPNDFQD